MDPLDAYMASLQLPEDHAQQVNGHTVSVSDAKGAREWRRAAGGATVKNRRYRRLQHLLLAEERESKGPEEAEEAFFSDAAMQQRSPALFHFYLGQYLPESARAATNGPMSEEAASLSAFLMKTRERSEMETRRVAEQERWGSFEGRDASAARKREQRLFEEDELEEEEDSSSDEESADEASIDERRRVLVEVMSARFLHGEDGEYVDYAAIDADETLDDLDEMDRDAQDRYFDEDD